jgi:hypothetical protein
LYTDIGPNFNITEKVSTILSTLLCNTSSIEHTRYSNHSLCNLGVRDDNLTPEIEALLEMNQTGDKFEVALAKVVETHFFDGYNPNVLGQYSELHLKVLPSLISWLGRDALGPSAVYEIIKNRPDVCKNLQCDGANVKSQKRSVYVSINRAQMIYYAVSTTVSIVVGWMLLIESPTHVFF